MFKIPIKICVTMKSMKNWSILQKALLFSAFILASGLFYIGLDLLGGEVLFKIIILLIFLILVYLLLKQEKKGTKITFLSYFSLLSIVFISGLFYISSTYHLSDHPIDGGFGKLSDWVSIFSYFYLIPTFILIAYKLFKFTNDSFRETWAKNVMLVFWVVVLLAVGFVSPFIFTLLFYGFAP